MKLLLGIEQGSAEWHKARLGIPTASAFDQIMTSKTRKLSASWKKYACRLIAERLMGQPVESLDGQHWMERGKELEPAAVAQYEFINEVKLTPVAFATNDAGTIGCSPDRVVMKDGKIVHAVEVKSPALHTHIYYSQFLAADEAYATQVQGQMMILEIDTNELYSFYPRGPSVSFKVNRDEGFIKDLSNTLNEFNDKLHEIHQKVLKMGVWIPADAQVITPHDRERMAQDRRELDEWLDSGTI